MAQQFNVIVLAQAALDVSEVIKDITHAIGFEQALIWEDAYFDAIALLSNNPQRHGLYQPAVQRFGSTYRRIKVGHHDLVFTVDPDASIVYVAYLFHEKRSTEYIQNRLL